MSECPKCSDSYKRLSLHFARSECGYPELSERKQELLKGVLMGDGSVEKQSGNRHGRFAVEMINKKFLEWLDSELEWLATGVNKVDQNTRSGSNENWEEIYRLRTRTHPYIDKLNSWYDSGKKRFPEDLELTPLITKMWYVSDGSLNTNGSPRSVFYSTNEWDRQDYIIDLFDDIGFSVTATSESFQLSVTGTQELFDWMGEAPPGFEYKWIDYEPQFSCGGVHKNKNWLHEKYVEKGLTQYEIAEEASVSQSVISRNIAKCDFS